MKLAARARSVEEGRSAVAQGFHILEITLPCPGGPDEEAAWRDLARRHELVYLAHGPQEGDPRDLAHLQKTYLPELDRAVAAARRLACPVLTIHFWLDSRFVSADERDAKISMLSRVSAWGGQAGVAVNLENLSEPWTDLDPAFTRVVDLGLTLDVGHAQLLTRCNTAPELIERFHSRLRHLHLHDNHGGWRPADDLHLPPGRGVVPYPLIFRTLRQYGYEGTATLELAPDEWGPARAWVLDAWREAARTSGSA